MGRLAKRIAYIHSGIIVFPFIALIGEPTWSIDALAARTRLSRLASCYMYVLRNGNPHLTFPDKRDVVSGCLIMKLKSLTHVSLLKRGASAVLVRSASHDLIFLHARAT